MKNTFRFEIDKLNASKYILACKRLGVKPEEELIHHINWVIKQSKRFMTKEVCNEWHTLLTDTSPAETPISSENKVAVTNAILEVGEGQYDFDEASRILNSYESAVSAFFVQQPPGDPMATYWLEKVLINDMYYKKMESMWREINY